MPRDPNLPGKPPREWPPSEGTSFPDGGGDPTFTAVLPRSATQAEVVRMLSARFPYYGSPDVRPVQFAETYAQLMAVAAARAEWLGELLKDALERSGMNALVGDNYALTKEGERVAISEDVRALVKLEADERARAEKLARDGIRIGIEAQQVDTMRNYGKTVVASLQAFTQELGLNWNDPIINRVARRAMLVARQRLGYDVRSPDEGGPALSEEEKARVLRMALG